VDGAGGLRSVFFGNMVLSLTMRAGISFVVAGIGIGSSIKVAKDIAARQACIGFALLPGGL